MQRGLQERGGRGDNGLKCCQWVTEDESGGTTCRDQERFEWSQRLDTRLEKVFKRVGNSEPVQTFVLNSIWKGSRENGAGGKCHSFADDNESFKIKNH